MCFQCGWMGLLTYDLTLCLAHAYTYVQKVSKYLAKEHKFETKLSNMKAQGFVPLLAGKARLCGAAHFSP